MAAQSRRGVISLSGATPLTHTLLDAPGFEGVLNGIVSDRRPDVVLAYCWAWRGGVSSRHSRGSPSSSTSSTWIRRNGVSCRRARARPCRGSIVAKPGRLSVESLAANQAAACLVVNQREAEIAQRLAPTANVHVVSNGVEIERLRPPAPPQPGTRVVFCGVMDYAPNHDAMMWFVRDVWPAVLAGRREATRDVRSGPQRALLAQCAKFPSITVTGRVEDVRPWLWESAVSVAPLLVARGLQNESIEAIAAGLPVVTTRAVAAGLPPQAEVATFVADSPRSFSDHVLELLSRTQDERRRLARSADLQQLSWDRTLERVWSILEAARHRAGQ